MYTFQMNYIRDVFSYEYALWCNLNWLIYNQEHSSV